MAPSAGEDPAASASERGAVGRSDRGRHSSMSTAMPSAAESFPEAKYWSESGAKPGEPISNANRPGPPKSGAEEAAGVEANRASPDAGDRPSTNASDAADAADADASWWAIATRLPSRTNRSERDARMRRSWSSETDVLICFGRQLRSEITDTSLDGIRDSSAWNRREISS